MNSQSLSRIVATCFISLAVAGNVEAVLIDNFNDGNDNGWSHIDNTTSSPWGPAIFDALSGSYTLATSGIVAEDLFFISDTFGSQWTASSAPQFSNGFFRAKMRANSEGTSFFLMLRQTGGNAYAFGGATNQNTFYISRVDDAVNIPLQELGPPASPITPGEDWILEAGAVGSQLSLKVWRDGEMVPTAPQLAVIDPTYSSGMFLVAARKDWAFQGTGQVSATFDDIVFTPAIAGDYNADGVVDAADYTVWRDNLGSGTSLPNDDTLGVGPDDYDRWKASFGHTAGSGSGAGANAGVPEPATMALAMIAAASLCACRAVAAKRSC